jgi:hypothetical protein
MCLQMGSPRERKEHPPTLFISQWNKSKCWQIAALHSGQFGSDRLEKQPTGSAAPGRNPSDLGEGAPGYLPQGGFTIAELIVVVTVVILLTSLAVGAYNKLINDARVAKSAALISTLATAKAMFVADKEHHAGTDCGL